MDSTNSAPAYTLGCDQASGDIYLDYNSEVILDFGAQLESGSGSVSVINDIEFTDAQIESLSEAFLRGYAACGLALTPSLTGHVTLGIGTNNSGSGFGYTTGTKWRAIVETVKNFENQISNLNAKIQGAVDLEPGFGPETDAAQWRTGFDETYIRYIDFGSADGCPTTPEASGECEPYDGIPWTVADMAELGEGKSYGDPAPEIYYPVQAEQWAAISAAAFELNPFQPGDYFTFGGPLSEEGAEGSDTSEQSWDQLISQLEGHSGEDWQGAREVARFVDFRLTISAEP